jgi:hypothetical protein
MLKIEVPAVLERVNAAEKDADFGGHGEFAYIGGNSRLKLSNEQFKALSNRVGEDMICVFGLSVKTVSLGKSWNASVFLPERLIEIKS